MRFEDIYALFSQSLLYHKRGTSCSGVVEAGRDRVKSVFFFVLFSEFGRYSGRVRFESSSPTENSALLIPSTEVSDEGRFTCHISTFPNGNFERHFTLTVWSKCHLVSVDIIPFYSTWKIQGIQVLNGLKRQETGCFFFSTRGRLVTPLQWW